MYIRGRLGGLSISYVRQSTLGMILVSTDGFEAHILGI